MITLIGTKTMLQKLKAGQIGFNEKRGIRIQYEGRKYCIYSTKNYFLMRKFDEKEFLDFLSDPDSNKNKLKLSFMKLL